MTKRTLKFVTLACALLAAGIAPAQTRDTAIVKGRVLDAQGGAISAGEVSLKNAWIGLDLHTRTDSRGGFVFANVPVAGRCTLSVTASGFEEVRQEDIRLRAGEAAIFNLQVNVAGIESLVTVVGTVDGVTADSGQLGTRFDLQRMDHLPILGRKLTSIPLFDAAARPARGTGEGFLPQTLFVINGGGRRQVSYSVDNTSADDSWARQTVFTTLPLTAVEEFTVLSNATSAEYGRNAGAAVNIVTKAGTSDFHGDILENLRPEATEASQPLAIRRTRDTLRQTSGAFSGPLVKDRSFFMTSVEHSFGKRDAVITSPQLFGEVFTAGTRQTLAAVRLDHKLTSRNAVMLRLNLDRFSDSNANDGVSGNNLPSAQRIFHRNTYSAQVSETASVSPASVNQFRFNFQLGSPITRFTPVTPSSVIVYPAPNAATYGNSSAANFLNHQYQWADTLSVIRGRHALKMGGDILYSSAGGWGRGDVGSGAALGQFTVSSASVRVPFDRLTIADMASYTQIQGNQSYNIRETLYGVFFQDDFAALPSLTLNIGLRYERQTFTQGDKNFAPRAGFAWRLPQSRPTVVRGSYGIYTSEVRTNYAGDDIINGPEGAYSYTANAGQIGFPTSLAAAPVVLAQTPSRASLPPRDLSVRAGQLAYLHGFLDVSLLRGYPGRMLNPNTQQWTLGVERELARDWVMGVSYVGSHTVHIDRPADLNAPESFIPTAPGQFRTCPEFPVAAGASASTRQAAAQKCADLTRPIVPVPGGYRQINAIIPAGAATYNGLQTKLTKRFSRRYSLLFTYTYSHALNTAEADSPPVAKAQDSTLLGNFEKANSVVNQPHRAVLSGWYEFPWRLVVGSSTSLASGRPFNVTTGNDNNGDGVNSDRPVIDGSIVRRNFGRGTPLYSVDLFLQKEFRLRERATLSFRAEAVNTLNHNNIVGRDGVWGHGISPLRTFGGPRGGMSNVEPNRQLQFMMRLMF